MKKDSSQDVVLPDSASTAPGAVTADAIPSASGVDTEPEATQNEAIDKEAVELEAEADKVSVGQQTDGIKITRDASQSAAGEADRPKAVPSILYCCPASLLDISSGAAVSQLTLMIALARRGFRALALQATIFDSTHGGEHVLKAGETHKDKPILRTITNGVEHLIMRTQAAKRHLMTCGEQENYLQMFHREISHRRPDMLFIWGGMLLEMTMMREAREAGIPVIFYLVNPGYKNKETFKYVSTVVTDTAATAKLYKERLGLDCKVCGKFINPGSIRPKVPRRPDFITFINPSFEKGVSVFMPLAKLAAAECPEIKFLVVQSRGRWGNALQVLKFNPQDFPNVKVIGHQTDMRPVYASTRALLLPSLWHESGARVIAEAQICGIPILASNTGGSAELVGQGGKIFDIPEDVRENKIKLLVTEETLRPWLEEIKRIWHDPAYYEALCQKVEKEAGQHDIERNTTRFIQAVSPVVLASKGIKPPAQPTPTPKAVPVNGNRAARRGFKHTRSKHRRGR